MLPLIWSAEAEEELESILTYIAGGNQAAADGLHAKIEYTAEQLPLHPYLYRAGRRPGTREAVVHPNYLLVYRVGTSDIEILSVLHARMQYP